LAAAGVAFFFGDGGFAIVGPYAAEVWPSHLRTSGMGSAYGFGGVGKIIGPVGLALIVGSGNYLKRMCRCRKFLMPLFISAAGS
jgi:putative MFS transporter